MRPPNLLISILIYQAALFGLGAASAIGDGAAKSDAGAVLERGAWFLMLANYFFFDPMVHPTLASWIPVVVFPLAILGSWFALSGWWRWTCVMLLIFAANMYSALNVARLAP
jgi:hypothetical protein